MYYFDQYDGLEHTLVNNLYSPMFYGPTDKINSDDIFTLTHVTELEESEIDDWVLICAVWLSRCGKAHILYMDSKLTCSLVDITDKNIFKRYTALPQV